MKAKKFLALFVAAAAACAIFTGCGKQQESGSLLICAAASMTDAVNEIKDLYLADNPNVTIDVTYGSSGALQTQIESGVGADLFISAAQKQMNALEEEGLVLSETRVDLLENKVVLVTPANADNGITSFEDVVSDSVSHIGLGDPESVPVGQYSQTIFENLGLWDQVTAKAVYGSDVRTVLTWVENGEVDCGIVYQTDAAISGDLVDIICEAPEGSCDPVIYPAAVLSDTQNQSLAEDFLNYLQSDTVSGILSSYGFTPLAGEN
jgi:molybdate transport system substrate-binding protein